MNATREEERQSNAEIVVDFLASMDLDLGDEIKDLMVAQDVDTFKDLIMDLSRALPYTTKNELDEIDRNIRKMEAGPSPQIRINSAIA